MVKYIYDKSDLIGGDRSGPSREYGIMNAR